MFNLDLSVSNDDLHRICGAYGEVKEVLSTIRGTLVEMPLLFLKEEDIAKEGVGLNAFTEELYT